MEKIKIISDPYNKDISYEVWNDEKNKWRNISISNPKSKLRNQKYTEGFLPFVITKIIEIIIEEYYTNKDKIEIIFEGNSDEFEEVKKVCEDDEYKDKLHIIKADKYLENAREIQPVITNVFLNNIHPIIFQNEDIEQTEEELESIEQDHIKYNDAITDIIPICVVGNYSAGKSSFINSLIGKEILPSGTKPMTSRIHKIFETNEEKNATISFSINDTPLNITFSEKGYEIDNKIINNNLIIKLKEELDKKDKTIVQSLNKSLEIINCYDNNTDNISISNEIKINISFGDGLLKKSKKKFLILDTPGSNSASNENHTKVLGEALDGFSNGLPIFVSELDSLDTTDNEDLFKAINDVEALDNRFTLIVVNKADGASLPQTEEEKDDILNQSVPKNLYSSGIYFVSSILGLGYKTDGKFNDSHSAEIFAEKKDKYIDQTSEYYKQLYKYNIGPKQLTQERTKNLDEIDKLYLNSGLYSIECAILNFAEKYSSYDKCKQSKLFLDRMVKTTSDAISTNKEKAEEYKEELKKDLEENKKQLLDSIDESDKTEFSKYENECIAKMNEIEKVEEIKDTTLENLQKEYSKKIAVEKDLSKFENELKESKKEIGENFKNNFKEFKNGKNPKDFFANIGKVAKEAFKDTQESFENSKELNKVKDDIRDESYKQLKNYMIEKFNKEFDKKRLSSIETSIDFWKEKCSDFKETLKKVISGSKNLDDEKKNELEKIIIEFEDIKLENYANEIFEEGNLFIHALNNFFEDILHIKFKNLSDKYNESLEKQVNDMKETIKMSHKNSFVEWKNKLIKAIKGDILNYSPVLHEKQQKIDTQQAKIDRLKSKLDKLNIYSKQINDMLEWK